MNKNGSWLFFVKNFKPKSLQNSDKAEAHVDSNHNKDETTVIMKRMPCEFGFNEVFICYLGAFTTNRRGVQHYGTLLQEMKGREVCLYQAHLGGSRFVDYGDDHDTTLTVLWSSCLCHCFTLACSRLQVWRQHLHPPEEWWQGLFWNSFWSYVAQCSSRCNLLFYFAIFLTLSSA